MKSPLLWLAVFVFFCFGAWLAVENGLNAEFRTTVADQAKQIEALTKEVASTQAKAKVFCNNLAEMLPEKAEVVKAAYVAQFGEPKPEPPKKGK